MKRGYNDLSYTENMASSTAIRNMIKNNGFEPLQNLMPPSSYGILIQNMQARSYYSRYFCI